MCVQWQGEEGTRQVLGTRVWGRRVWRTRVWGTRVWAPAHEGVVVIVPSLAAVEEGNPPVVCSQASWLCHKKRVQERVQEACVRSVCNLVQTSMLLTSEACLLQAEQPVYPMHQLHQRDTRGVRERPEHRSIRAHTKDMHRARERGGRQGERARAGRQASKRNPLP